MKALVCEMCGSTDLVKENGLFVCQSCGVKYSLEEARKMMIDGTVNVTGTVKVDKSENLKNLYILARRAKDENDIKNAEKYYDLILLEDPNSWEANFYQRCYKAMSCPVSEISSSASSIKNNLNNTLSLIFQNEPDKTKRVAAFCEITYMTTKVANALANEASDDFKKIYSQMKDLHSRELWDITGNEQFVQDYVDNTLSSAQICYTLGDLFETMKETSRLSCVLWKTAIEIHENCIRFVPGVAFGFGGKRKTHKTILENYTTKINWFEPNYKRP